MSGRIELIIGPMFAGKSTELLRRLRRYSVAKKNCKRIKHESDNLRVSSSGIVTHDDQVSSPAEPLKFLKGIADTDEYLNGIDVIGIDEGQFFPDIGDYAEYVANKGKIVIIAALDSTFERKPFPNITNLISAAEKVTKLSAVCYRCSKSAAFSKRLGDSKELQLIGGSKDYVASCRDCFYVPIIEDVSHYDIADHDLAKTIIEYRMCIRSNLDSDLCESNDIQREILRNKLYELSLTAGADLLNRCTAYADSVMRNIQ